MPLARMEGDQALLMRAAQDVSGGGVYFLGALPDPGSSSLARDGVVLYAMLQRALAEGAGTLGKARQAFASAAALGPDPSQWRPVEEGADIANLPLRAGVVESGDRLIALNRPPGEDVTQILSRSGLNDLFSGLDFHVFTGTLEDSKNLTNEVWRTFLVCMALALLGESLLCLPPRRTEPPPSWAEKEKA